jgi:hypothetical protein
MARLSQTTMLLIIIIIKPRAILTYSGNARVNILNRPSCGNVGVNPFITTHGHSVCFCEYFSFVTTSAWEIDALIRCTYKSLTLKKRFIYHSRTHILGECLYICVTVEGKGEGEDRDKTPTLIGLIRHRHSGRRTLHTPLPAFRAECVCGGGAGGVIMDNNMQAISRGSGQHGCICQA